MIDSINVSQKIKDVQTPDVEPSKQYVSMRGSDYERTPEGDTFESGNKKAKNTGIIAGLAAIAAIVVGGICLKKGGKVLEGKDVSFIEKLKTGWKELIGAGKKDADKAAKEAEERAAKEAEERAKIEAEVRAKIEAENKAKKEAEEKAKAELKEKERKEIEERELRAEQWRKNSQAYVDNIEKQLNGNITVNVNEMSQSTREQILSDAKATTNKLSSHAKKHERATMRDVIDSKLNYTEIKNLDSLYDLNYLINKFGTQKQKDLYKQMEIKLKRQAEMKLETDAIVRSAEKTLNGSGFVNQVKQLVPKKPTKAEHKKLQQQYNSEEFLRELDARKMQANSAAKVKKLEQKLDGSGYVEHINQSVPKKPTYAEHKRKQAYYDSLSEEITRKNEQFELQELEKENKALRAKLKKLQRNTDS